VYITVHDDESLDASNIYTITVNIDHTNHKPYYSGGDAATILPGWTVGSQPVAADLPKILISGFSDHDASDTPVFDATHTCTF